MKGTLFIKPLELNLNIEGEEWNQNDSIKGTFCVKNHGKDSIELKHFGVGLAWAEKKKISKSIENAFRIESKHFFSKDLSLNSNKENKLDWEFKLDKNCPITHKSGSYYILYGNLKEIASTGQLQLIIHPKVLYKEVLDVFIKFFRFKTKDIKSKKDFVDAKLIPPNSNDFANMDALNLSMRLNDKTLELIYSFKMQKLKWNGDGGMEVNKIKRDYQQSLGPKDYLLYKDSIDQEKIIKSVGEIIDQVKAKEKF